MFLREGPQLRVQLMMVCCALCYLGSAGHVAMADGARAPDIQLPKEILPWRRGVERQAFQRLGAARRALGRGDMRVAEQTLRDLVRRFPGTHAAVDGQRDLSNLRERRTALLPRQSLGASRGQMRMPQSQAPVAPVAGWHTTVRPDATHLRDALIEAAGDRVFFNESSIRLDRQSLSVLRKQARWLKVNEGVDVRIVGHADDRGSPEKNMRLSHDRAVVVRKRLIRYGISPRRLHVFSHGKAKPIAICTVDTCGAHNRRVVTEVRSSQHADANLQ